MLQAISHATAIPSLPHDLAGAAAALLLLPVEAGAAKAVELDGELLAICAEAVATDARAEAIMDAIDRDDLSPTDPRWSPTMDDAQLMLADYHDAITRAARLPARTPEGLRAKARLVVSYFSGDGGNADLALSLARDLIGRA